MLITSDVLIWTILERMCIENPNTHICVKKLIHLSLP